MARTFGRQAVRLARRIHHVAQPLDAELGLLELRPQADDAHHRLAELASKHLEGDQHADREARLGHHGVGADHQDGERLQLIHRAGEHVVGIADLLGLKARLQVGREVVRIALPELRLHLQALHRFKPADVFGDESLVARAEQKLLVEPALEDRRDDEARDADHEQDRDRDRREDDAVPEHHAEADQQERHVEHQRHGCTGDELANVLHAVQPCGDHAGGAVLEVTHRQLQKVVPDRCAEHGIDPIAGVKHQVLPHPGEEARENGEDDHRDADGDQRALRAVHDHLVDDGLRKERRGERDELQREGGEQHVAPHLLVLEQFGHEPTEAEGSRGAGPCVRVGQCFGLRAHQPGVARAHRRELGLVERARRVGSGGEEDDLAVGRSGDDREARLWWIDGIGGPQGHEQGKDHALDLRRLEANLSDLERQRTSGGDQRAVRAGGWELTLKQLARERQPMQGADGTERPKKFLLRDRLRSLSPDTEHWSCPCLCRRRGMRWKYVDTTK